jgi:hypothetical protein
MSDDDSDKGGGNEEESENERLDRELIELLNELRVALPGVQVIFAFLLTVPFSQRFEALSDIRRDAYFGTFVCASLASILLIAPSAQHRLLWRKYDKEELLKRANRLAIAGLALLALAIVGATFLVTDLVFETEAAAGVAAGIAGVATWFWYVVPLWRRIQQQ